MATTRTCSSSRDWDGAASWLASRFVFEMVRRCLLPGRRDGAETRELDASAQGVPLWAGLAMSRTASFAVKEGNPAAATSMVGSMVRNEESGRKEDSAGLEPRARPVRS